MDSCRSGSRFEDEGRVAAAEGEVRAHDGAGRNERGFAQHARERKRLVGRLAFGELGGELQPPVHQSEHEQPRVGDACGAERVARIGLGGRHCGAPASTPKA